MLRSNDMMPPRCSSSSLKSYERVQGAEAAPLGCHHQPHFAILLHATRTLLSIIARLFSSLFLILDVYIMNNNPKRFLLRILTRTVDEHLASRHLAFFALNFYCMALEQRRSTESTRFEPWKSAGPHQALLPCYTNDEGPHFSL